MSVGWGPEDKQFKVLAFKIIDVIWIICLSIANWTIFIHCHRKQVFSNFYAEIDVLNEKLQALGVTLDTRRLRRNHLIILIIALALGIGNTAIKLWDLSTDEVIDPLFGWTWNMRNNSYERHIGIKILSQSGMLIMLSQAGFYCAFYVSNCYTMWSMLAHLNKQLENQVAKSTRDTLLQIESYRAIHLRLCGLVCLANKLFTGILTTTLSGYVVGGLLFLSLLAMPSTRPESFIEYAALGYWLFCSVSFTAITIFFAQQVLDKVCLLKCLVTLLACFFSCYVFLYFHTMYTLCIALFLGQVQYIAV